MIPADHPRYRSLVARERLADAAREGIASLEGLTAHGRGEAFDYLIGERTTPSAAEAEELAVKFFREQSKWRRVAYDIEQLIEEAREEDEH